MYKLRISTGLANEASIVSAAQCWCWGRPCQLPQLEPRLQTTQSTTAAQQPAAASSPTNKSLISHGRMDCTFILLTTSCCFVLGHIGILRSRSRGQHRVNIWPASQTWPPGAVRAVTTTIMLSPTRIKLLNTAPQPLTAQPWSAPGPERRCLESLVLWPLVSCSGGQLELA